MTQPSPLHIERGVCYALFAYDVALSITLDEAERQITALTQRETIRQSARHRHISSIGQRRSA